MKTSSITPVARLERELEREREQRHQNDEAKAGIVADDDLRVKDARASNRSGQLHRSCTR